MSKKDFVLVTVIGAAIGFLVQPILDNLIRDSVPLASLFGGHGLTLGIRAALVAGFLILGPLALLVGWSLGRLMGVGVYQFAKFSAVGTLNTFLKFGLINLMSFATRVVAGPLVSLFAAFAFGLTTLNGFYWHRIWTFGATHPRSSRETAHFWIVSLCVWFLYTATVTVVVALPRPAVVPPAAWLNVGALCGSLLSAFGNFFGYKYLVFKKSY